MLGRNWIAGWTLVRIVFGVMLCAAHGIPKAMGDLTPFIQRVGSLGFPMPTFFAWCAVLTEVVGGILIALGLFTRPVAAFASFTMIVAAYRHQADPFSAMEKPLLFLTVFVALILGGAGPWSLDAKVRRKA
ncbi:DoxX family protein [Hyalangium rubrum]|uniref:DoxX family protein n=1 Tax=Hyalangium rubrum TaxID=3103134 RepID=A0ABU5HAP2_9BACT|nr:DoxX family protein [Hyalangium sp. s54d21]MDY7230541.1 DoxX family protein [Hyalangium sp. s54d21]